MKQGKFMCRLLGLILAIVAFGSTSAFASNSNFYSKATVKAVGKGKVYVSYKNQTSNPEYATEHSVESGKDSQRNAPTHTYYLYTQAEDGYKFDGWYEDESCSSKATSVTGVANPFTFNITASTETASKTLWAKFVLVGAAELSYSSTHLYIDGIGVTANNEENLTTEGVTEAITYRSSNENVATVAADGTVTAVGAGSCAITASANNGEASYVVTVVDNTQSGKTQIGNGDFEDWRGVTSKNHAPNNWNSFETAEGSYASTVSQQQVEMSTDHRPGSNGLYSAKIYSKNVSVLGFTAACAQGNLTTGCINAGSMSATGADNHNFSKIADEAKSETVSKIPTAIRAWVKFNAGKVNDKYPYARIAATVHDAYNYITYGSAVNDTEVNKSHAIAQAELNFTQTDGEWKELLIPFDRLGNAANGDQLYVIVNFSTNAEPGQGQLGDELYVDDVELVYDDVPVTYNKHIVVAINGNATEPIESSIDVVYGDDNKIDFNLKNFALDVINVGNISLKDLTIADNGDFSFDGNIVIENGDKAGVEDWIGPSLGEIPATLRGSIYKGYFYVNIDIDFQAQMGQIIGVEVGDRADATIKVSDALVSTFCAPFNVAIPEEYREYVTASKVMGVDGNVLEMEAVEGFIPANTPVIIEIPQEVTMSVSGIFKKGTPVCGLLTGTYALIDAPVGSYILQNNDSKVGFYKVAATGLHVGANRCYLTKPSSDVKAFYFDEETAIKTIEALTSGKTEIYDLNGRKLHNLQKGINIVNGKKILVK